MTNIDLLCNHNMINLSLDELMVIEGGSWWRDAAGWVAGACGAVIGCLAGMAAGSVVPGYGTAVGGAAGTVLGYMEGQKAGFEWYDSVFGN